MGKRDHLCLVLATLCLFLFLLQVCDSAECINHKSYWEDGNIAAKNQTVLAMKKINVACASSCKRRCSKESPTQNCLYNCIKCCDFSDCRWACTRRCSKLLRPTTCYNNCKICCDRMIQSSHSSNFVVAESHVDEYCPCTP